MASCSLVSVTDYPFIRRAVRQSTTYQIDPTASVAMETCNGSSFAENGGTDRHHVPHFLPGQNADAREEWLKDQSWIPEKATHGGAKTTYPEYRATLNGSLSESALTVPASKSAINLEQRIAAQAPRDGEVHVLPVQGNVYMLVVDGYNVTASVGPDGVLMVNTGPAPMTEKLQAAVNQSRRDAGAAQHQHVRGRELPGRGGGRARTECRDHRLLRRVRSATSQHTSAAAENIGGNEKLATSGFFPRVQGFGAAVANVGRGASIVAHENVLNRMSAPAGKQRRRCRCAAHRHYFDELHKLPEYVNGEAVIVYHAPAATTDGEQHRLLQDRK